MPESVKQCQQLCQVRLIYRGKFTGGPGNSQPLTLE